MADLTTRRLLLGLAAVVLVAVLGVRQLGAQDGPAAPAPVAGAPVAVEEEGGGEVVVHVAGAVRRPGVYELAGGERVDDAVARAGGPTRRADLGGLNLAAEVQDGRQVLVPERPRRGDPAPATGAAAPAEGQPLNLNTATLEQLDQLSGVGPATAQKILDFREERGGFGAIEELDEIPGIGEQRLAVLREEATL